MIPESREMNEMSPVVTLELILETLFGLRVRSGDPSSGCKLRKQIGVGKAEAVGPCGVEHWRAGSHAVEESQSGEILLNKRPFYKNKNPSKAMP